MLRKLLWWLVLPAALFEVEKVMLLTMVEVLTVFDPMLVLVVPPWLLLLLALKMVVDAVVEGE